MKNFSRLFKPYLDNSDLKAIKKVFDKNWIGLGEEVGFFENEFSNFIGSKYCCAVNSGTAALHLALSALNLKPKKKVLVNNLTFIASASVILMNDLIPVFVDCDQSTLQIDIKDLKKKIDKDVEAMIIVHYGGASDNLKEIIKLLKAKSIKIIEDCAHTQGGEYQNKKLGTIGDLGCFSFEEKKGMTTGDGGMIVTNKKFLYLDVNEKRWLGINKKHNNKSYIQKDHNAFHWFYIVSKLGYKYNMNNLSASLGRSQLKKLNKFNKKKEILINFYLKNLIKNNYINPLLNYETNKSSYWLFGIRVNPQIRDKLIIFLKKHNIATGVHFYPMTLQPLFKKYKSRCINSENIWKEIITLPLHYDLSRSDINFITDKINYFFDIHK